MLNGHNDIIEGQDDITYKGNMQNWVPNDSF